MNNDQTFEQEIQAQLADIKSVAKKTQSVSSSVALMGLKPEKNTNIDGVPPLHIATIEDKKEAIQDIYDMEESCLMHFVMLGDVARAIKDKVDYYDGEKIEFGFPYRQLTPEIKSLFNTWKFEETSYGYKYFYTPDLKWDVKIPVEIHIWKKNYPFFENLDIGFFGVDDYRIPNPFDAYWKVRGIIK